VCGICGVLNFRDEAVNREILAEMNQTLFHRGPDEDGLFVDGRVGMAMRRLSIIDLESGKQPIHNEDRSVQVVQNGEIYNFQQLRKKLQAAGHRFYTHSDTETIVHAYEAYGEDFVNHLRGMFAIAIWDSREQKLLLARDRAGIKPLFYYVGSGQLIFGSEIKAILKHPAVSKRIDLHALDAYFTNCFVPAPKTIFENIYKLLPGYTLIVDQNGIRTQQYWELSYQIDHSKTEADFLRLFNEKFTEAVKIRMISDVPLGAMLSGGIDSSAIVATMSRLSDQRVKTFSIGFEGNVGAFDETNDAKLVAERFDTDHHVLTVRPDLRDLAPWIARFFDEPFGNSSAIPNFYVSQMAREHVTVALNGLGGDEVAVGYSRHLGLLMSQYYRKLPGFLRKGIIPNLVKMLPDSSKGGVFNNRLKRFVQGGSAELYKNYLGYMTHLSRQRKQVLYTPELLANANGYTDTLFGNHFNLYNNLDVVNRALFADLKFDLPDNLLTLTDRMSMAVSLEARVPFLDHELLELMASMPPAYKRHGLQNKYFLKKAFDGVLPKEILFKKKQGFTIPLALWFRTDLKHFVESVLSRDRLNRIGFLRYETVREMLENHFRARENYHQQIWSFMIFVLWYEANFPGRYL